MQLNFDALLSLDTAEQFPAARRTDPTTSHQAAASARELREQHHSVILAALRAHGPAGKDRIAALTRLTGVQICRRLIELQRDGLIQPTGRTVLSTAGRNEREWEALSA
jgi:predicted ArsR family transcriptional regulator